MAYLVVTPPNSQMVKNDGTIVAGTIVHLTGPAEKATQWGSNEEAKDRIQEIYIYNQNIVEVDCLNSQYRRAANKATHWDMQKRFLKAICFANL